jgi:hypothetical protein
MIVPPETKIDTPGDSNDKVRTTTPKPVSERVNFGGAPVA